MQILCRSTFSIGRVGSALPLLCRWRWPSALARRDAPPMSSASAHPKQHLDRVSGFVNKPWRTQLLIANARATTKCMDKNTENTRKESTKDNNPAVDKVYFRLVLLGSTHRDGAIYKNNYIQEQFSESDLADLTETRLEPMQFSKATKECFPDAENCRYHFPQQMIQFFSVLLSKSPISNSSIQLYGYIAARDEQDGMLNYLVSYSRDDPIIVEQGSH